MSRSEHSPSRAAKAPSPLRSPAIPRSSAIVGAHRAVPRAHRRSAATLPQQTRHAEQPPSAHHEPYLDGLFSYCLSVLCEHDAAIAALGDALAVAERYAGRLRDPGQRRAWLYALARWACTLRLAEGADAPWTDPAVADQRRRQLAALAWPEAAGTTPEQREVLELAVRHQLGEREIAAVLGLETEAARCLLSRAACEVERTRTALAVVDIGGCPAVARLAGETRLLLSAGLRRELVRHIDECPGCRLTAEHVVAGGPWPGSSTTEVLAVVEAPRAAVYAAMAHALHAARGGTREPGRGEGRPVPRLDRRGFPLADRERAARRALLRHRVLTTTVVAAVAAAPALALWAAYCGATHTAEGHGGNGVSTAGAEGGAGAATYERTGSESTLRPRHSGLDRIPGAEPSLRVDADGTGDVPQPPGAPAPASVAPPAAGATPSAGPGWITVAAQPRGGDTAITLTASGGSPVRWTAGTAAPWLRLSATSGVLRPGESTTITAAVDHATEPAGPWQARIVIDPAGSVVTVEGQGSRPAPSGSTAPAPSPSGPRPTPAAS